MHRSRSSTSAPPPRTTSPTAAATARLIFALAMAGLPILSACGDDDPVGPSQGGELSVLFTQVSAAELGVNGTFDAGSLPQPGTGPALLMTQEGTWAAGGTGRLSVTTTTQTPPFTELLLSAPSHSGFYRLTFEEPRANVTLTLQISPEATPVALTLRLVGIRDGLVGPYDVELVEIGE